MASIIDVLELIRLKVWVYHNARVCGDWQLNEYQLGHTYFHMPTQGDCLMVVPGHGEWHLKAGDVVFFPKELPHSLQPTKNLFGPQKHLPIAESQTIDGTSMLCGEISFQHRGSQKLLDALPPVIVGNGEQAKHWLNPITELILHESLLPNSTKESPILNRLCELLISYTLRCFAENSEQSSGIFALYSDQRLAKTLTAVHAEPAHPWQLNELAEHSNMSRTQFANYFKQLCGWTPLQYITWWRMQLAYSLLQQGRTVTEAADAIGYGSDAAFNRAFKKAFDETPGIVRKSRK